MTKDKIDNYLTPDDTRVMKCIAIICMLMHHLWFFPNRLAGEPLTYIFTVFNATSLQFFGIFGKICVPMFFFFGGYGVYKSSYGKPYDIVERLKKLYFAYWKVFLIFVPIGFLFFSTQAAYCTDPFIYTRFANFSTRELISNFFGFTSTYNREWWFLISYAFALVTFPIIRAIIDRYSAKTNILIVILVSLLFANIFPGLRTSTTIGVPGNNFLYVKFFCQIAPYAACFWMGAVTARNGLLDRFSEAAKANKLLNPFTDIAAWATVIYLRQCEIGDTFDIFFIPVLTVASIDLLNRVKVIKNAFVQMGKESTSMWLIHPFFCYYFGLLSAFVTSPRIAILSLLLLIASTYLASVLVSLFWNGVGSLYNRVKKKLTAKKAVNSVE